MYKKISCNVWIFSVLVIWLSCFISPAIVAAGNATNVDTPKPGGELVIGMFNCPKHLNPAIVSGVYTGMPGAQLFAAPLRYDENWNPQPYLAEKWEIAKDGLSVTLHLVKGASFHDGKAITSEDVAFSVMTVKKHHPFHSMFAPVEKVETPDPQTAVIRLNKPHPAILLAMSSVLLPIIPKHIYGDGRDIKTHPANIAPVGSGPFKFVEFVPGKHIILERYDKFFIKDRPYLDKISYKFFKIFDELSLSGGEINLLPYYFNPMGYQLLENDKNLIGTNKGYEGIGPMYWLAFNTRKKPLDDLRVRQAIAYCIDRDFIINTIFHGKSKQATGPIIPDSPFYSADVEQYQVDVKKANELLDEAGYTRNKTGKRFELTIDFIPGKPAFIEYLKDDLLRKIGVELTVRASEDFTKWSDIVANNNFMITHNTFAKT